MKPINLGRKYDNPCCAPCDVKSEDKVHFPCLYLENVTGKIPDSGTITLRFEVRSRNERPKDGKTSLELEMLQIVDVKGDEKAAEKLSAADTLDKLAAEVTDKDDTPEEKKSSREGYVEDES